MNRYRMPHPFAPPHPGGTPLGELIERHAHLVAVGLANCRAAQALHKEINRRKQAALSQPPQAPLSNDDDNNHFNPKEHRDGDGKWTTGPDASGSKANASVAAQAKGAPLKFGAGLNQGLQQVASNIGQGMAQLSDPGALKDNFSTFLQAQDQALGMVPNPHFDPLTGEVSNDDLYEQARWRMFEQREIERERLRAPWESFSEAAAEVAAEFGHLKDTTPGPNWVGTAGVMTGETLGYAAPSAIPVVGQVTGPVTAALASIGDTFNQAYDAYKKCGLPDDQAREMASKVAINTGVTTGLIFALPIGRLASLPTPALSKMLLAMGISGAQLSADKLQSLLQARATFNPNLTLADIAKETGNSFLIGAIVAGSLHGAQRINPAELARLRGAPGQGPEIPQTETANTKPTPPPMLLQPLSAAERQALDVDVQARKPISMDTIEQANITDSFPPPKGYEFDVLNNQFIYTGLDVPSDASGTLDGSREQPSEAQKEQAPSSNDPRQQQTAPMDGQTSRKANTAMREKGPIQNGEVTSYQEFRDRSVKGDNLEGHELWQHANLKAQGLATTRLSTEASKQNPVISLDRETHKRVNAAQRSIDASLQTPAENIRANADILRKLRVAQDEVIDQLEQMAHQHAKNHTADNNP